MKIKDYLWNLAQACSVIAGRCRDDAAQIEQAHSDAVDELNSLLAFTAVSEGIGLAAAWITFGASEIPAQGAVAIRLAAAAGRIAEIIRALQATIDVAVGLMSTVILRIAVIVTPLRLIISGARVSMAEVTTAGDAMAAVREMGKAGELMVGTIKNTQHITSLTGTAKYRIPDELDARVIDEVKNVASRSNTDQLKDFLAYAVKTVSLSSCTCLNTPSCRPNYWI